MHRFTSGTIVVSSFRLFRIQKQPEKYKHLGLKKEGEEGKEELVVNKAARKSFANFAKQKNDLVVVHQKRQVVVSTFDDQEVEEPGRKRKLSERSEHLSDDSD